MKIILNDKNQVSAKVKNRPEQYLFDKVRGFAIRRRSKYSFFYKDKLYDMKGGVIKPYMSKAYKKYLDESR